ENLSLGWWALAREAFPSKRRIPRTAELLFELADPVRGRGLALGFCRQARRGAAARFSGPTGARTGRAKRRRASDGTAPGFRPRGQAGNAPDLLGRRPLL